MTEPRNILVVSCALLAYISTAGGTACYTQTPTTATASADQSTADVKADLFKPTVTQIKNWKSQKNEPQAEAEITRVMNPYIVLIAAPGVLEIFRSELQEWRTDVQTESPTSSAGTTSLVSKGSVPSLLGLAVENGALTQSASGTSVTFRTNPTGLINALQKHGYAASGPESYTDPVVKFVNKLSAAVTFNTSSSSTTSSTAPSSTNQGTQGILTGSAQQISNVDVRYDLINHRDPRDPKYTQKWKDLKNDQLAAVAAKANEFAARLKGINPPDPVEKAKFATWEAKVQGWIAGADAAVDDAAANSVQTVVLKVADDFVKTFGDDPGIKAAADDAAKALSGFLKTSGNIRNLISKSPILTLEYTDIRQGTMTTAMAMASASATTATPASKLPDLSNLKLIIARGTVAGTTVTANASLTLFNENPQAPDKGRIRDFQLSAQADIPLREIQSIGVPTLTFAGLFLSLRRQPLGMPVQVNGVDVNLKGNIGFAQAKVSFPVKKGSGVNIPLSITYASRTELNKEHDIRGSIGMTLNLDSVFASTKP